VDGVTGENTSYSYDALNRLTNASNSLWSEAYTYDGFGNLTAKAGSGGSPNPAPTVSMTYNSKNQLTNLYYDANGNQNAYYSPSGGNTYSVENRLTLEVLQNSSPYPANIYAYDPWGKRVMSGYNPNYNSPQPAYNYTFYGITGQKLAAVTCNGSNYPAYPTCAIVGQNVYFGKKLIVAGGATVLTDRLGSVRANGQGESAAYYPYGEERTSTVDGREKFGTYFRDAIGQDYADQRYYGSGTGSFFTPDRLGAKGARLNDPISWNGYAFVAGDPINRTDSHGSCYTDPPPEHEGEGCYGGVGGDPSPRPPNCAISLLHPEADAGCGGGGGGGSSAQVGDFLNGPATKKQQKQFQKAFKDAESKLKNKDCAGLYGGSGTTTMDASTYTLAASFVAGTATPDTDPFATTEMVSGQPTDNVTLNLVGPFFTPSSSPLGQLLSGAGLSVTDIEAFVLLHELGHETGVLGDDTTASGAAAAAQFNVQILNDCFGVNAQVKR
jgi:RHS repeat-associated protein